MIIVRFMCCGVCCRFGYLFFWDFVGGFGFFVGMELVLLFWLECVLGVWWYLVVLYLILLFC